MAQFNQNQKSLEQWMMLCDMEKDLNIIGDSSRLLLVVLDDNDLAGHVERGQPKKEAASRLVDARIDMYEEPDADCERR